ncbi:ATPase, F1 complex, gamma subunit domain [Pseudocohnilembus persalinus]|uniref:ATP synthase subunit gamma n=1 Tax=Pseudocohnilembus persalinus TaxID=266149 RepID=A0A0V0QN03_PSEPJ|nr:ATPase, F1 complex, gamma subunit domain [Pseudocohnilembus persalinus]|eukprot:KRX03737.1 ATPase, F1 complex, gamma subunit domain [Pseudocohnilembus persalinus]
MNTLVQVPKYAFGANLKALKTRMKSVGSIKKITKAMKMIAATKMRMEVKRLEQGQNFGVGQVQRLMDTEAYIQRKQHESQKKRQLVVPLTSDKGLCGAINSSIVRDIKGLIGTNHSAYRIFNVGIKGESALLRPFPDIVKYSISFIQQPVNWPTTCSVAHQVGIAAEKEQCDNIIIVFNWYKNAVTQLITHTDIMPKELFFKNFKYLVRHEATEPDLEYSKQYFYELYTGSIFYNSFLHNNASEQSSRMNAMENASKNAGEMLDKLTLQYNKARQAKITTELIEVISGAESATNG